MCMCMFHVECACETPSSFPALVRACSGAPTGTHLLARTGWQSRMHPPWQGLRSTASWVLDKAAAGELSVDYAESFALMMSRGDCNPTGVN